MEQPLMAHAVGLKTSLSQSVYMKLKANRSGSKKGSSGGSWTPATSSLATGTLTTADDDDDATDDGTPMGTDPLQILTKIDCISLHGVWIPDAYGDRTYRYLHYTAFGRDRMKVLEADIENTYASCCLCCFGCSSKETRVNIKTTDGHHIFSIHLTGELKKQPMDAADIMSPDGNLIATAQWKSPYFQVYDVSGLPLLTLKRNRFNLCALTKAEQVVCPDTKEPLGKIHFTFSLFGPSWSDGYVLTTEVPPYLDLKHRVAWISLLFLLKLCHRGREYAKISRIE